MDIKKILSELTLEEKVSMCSGQDFWHTTAVERLGVPAVMMCDGPHGLWKQEGDADHMGLNPSIETVCYPTASALASSFDRKLLGQLGTALGQECQAEHVGMLLGPGVNIKRSPVCGRNFEYFSEDPYLAGELASAYIEKLQGEGVAACVKHFACNNQETRRMAASSNVSERALHEIYFPAFETIVKKGKARAIMCAYNALNGTFCVENRTLLKETLRDAWGFDGITVTDWGAVKDRVKGLQVGLDLEMPGGFGSCDGAVLEAVQNGTLDEKVLDETVYRILKFVDDTVNQQKQNAKINRAENSLLSENMEEQCAVLLKNEGLLPIAEGEDVVFIGEFADIPRYQGTGSSHINVPHAVSALETMGQQVSYAQGYDTRKEERNDELLAQAVQAAQKAKVAVIFAGLPDSFETEGCDRAHMMMPEAQNILISEVAKVNPNTVVVLHGGAPMELPWIHQVKSVLCMYLGGERVGEAAVKLLYGKANPSGKLAETWPCKLSDNPSYLNFPDDNGQVTYHEDIFVGYRYYDKKEMPVLFPFGYGLSYTEFAYDNLTVDKESADDTDIITVTCTVKNTGDIFGQEAVQLYVRDVESSARRPVRELKGFEKVALNPGEEKEITFTLDQRSFAYYEPMLHDWFVESGKFVIEIGASSRDIRLSKEIEIRGTKELPIVYTKDSTIGDFMKTAAGRSLVEKMMAETADIIGMASDVDVNCMGEVNDQMIQDMVNDLPIGSFVSYRLITSEQLDGMLAAVNHGGMKE